MAEIIKTLCAPITEIHAEVAQLVEHNLAKVGVASSSLVFRSITKEVSRNADFTFGKIYLTRYLLYAVAL